MRLHLQVKKKRSGPVFYFGSRIESWTESGRESRQPVKPTRGFWIHHNDTRTTGAEFKVKGLESFRTADKIQTVPSAVVAS